MGVTTLGAQLVQMFECGKRISLLWVLLGDSLHESQGLDGGPVVSCCLRAWRRPNTQTPAFAPHRTNLIKYSLVVSALRLHVQP
jgi:hypothetical protein